MAQSGAERTRAWRERRKAVEVAHGPGLFGADAPAPDAPPWAGLDGAKSLKVWAETVLKVPAGRLAGRPFVLEDWQVDALARFLAADTVEGALCTARKNGKTGLIIALVLGHVAPGAPLQTPRWRGLWVSLTGDLAAEGRRQADEIIDVSGLSGVHIRKSPAPGSIVGVDGSDCKMLAADKSSGHAAGADLAVIDEGGLLPERKRALWDAITSATSGRDGRTLAISVRGDGPMFREMRARAGEPGVEVIDYQAPADCRLDDESAWRAANPGLGSIKSLDYMRHRAATALANPASAAGFRSLDLNQAVAPTVELLCDMEQWRAVESDKLPAREGRCWLGIDLGGSLSLSAAAALWESGRLDLWCAVPAEPDLLARGRRDGVGDAYVRAVDSGHLVVCGRRIVDAGRFLAGVFESMPAVPSDWLMGCDRYRRSELQDVLSALGQAPAIKWRGTGASATADGAYDVRAFQSAVALRAFQVGENSMMRLALAGAAVRRDSAGNPALDKSSADARIDMCSAAVIAFGLRSMARERRQARTFAIARAS